MNAQELLRELTRTIEELRALNEIGKALTSTLDIGEVLKLIMDRVGELLKVGSLSLLLKDENTSELTFEIAVGPGAEKLKGLKLAPGEGIAGWVANHGQPLLVPEARSDPRFDTRFDERTGFQTRSIIAVPLKVKDRTLGVIELVNGPAHRAFDNDDVRVASTIADYAAIALENARNFRRVQELTIIDEHTGLFNTRHLMQVLSIEFQRARRYGHPMSLLFFDLDHFKQVNDTYGHQYGSELLRECGRLVANTLRATDIAHRYGGDEFVCVLPETDKPQAVAVGERLRDIISAHPFLAAHGLKVHLTASFGVATAVADGEDESALLKAADMAMYQAKESGRNEVRAASDKCAPKIEPDPRAAESMRQQRV